MSNSLKTTASMLAKVPMLAMGSRVSAQSVTGGTGAGDPATQVYVQVV